MTGSLEITGTATASEWDGFVRDHPDATGYHAWGWRHVFERALGHETCYLTARENGAIVGVLPLVIFRSRVFGRFAVSLPFLADAAGVCVRDARVADALVAHARTVAAAKRLSHVEFRHLSRQLPALPVRQHRVGMRLTLERDVTSAWNALDRKLRNQVRKAEKNGLTVRSGGLELLDRFYAVFGRNMRDLGTPVFPRRLFEQSLTTFADSSRILLVERADGVVAGGVAFAFRDTLAVPWASSLREHRALCGNTLLYWHLIQHAIALGLSTFDFGRSAPGAGTYQFKEQWGARSYPLYWECAPIAGAGVPSLDRENPKFNAAVAAWKHLPLPLTRWLGPHISRSLP